MIEAIKEIGEYTLIKEHINLNEPLDLLIDDPESNHNNPLYKNILLILLHKSNEDYKYKGIDIEQYSESKLRNYLYRQGSSKGTDITPTSRITTIESTFVNTKIIPWFEKYAHKNQDGDFLAKLCECLKNNKEKILEELKVKYDGIRGKNEKAVLTLKIDNKYVGDYKIFKMILLKESTEGFYSKYNTTSKAENKICYVCNKEQKEVYGFVGTFKFYTVDKPGFVSGGFRQKNAWKNYPVCLNCALTLEAGRKYLRDYLIFNFYGFNYHLIPKFILKESYSNIKEFFDIIEDWRNPKFVKKEIERISQDEDEILKRMSNEKNYFNINFMFYDAPKGYDGAVFNILLYIEDILPSRLKKIFEIKKEVDKIDIFKDCLIPVFENKKKSREKSLEFNFGVLRTFFPRTRDEGVYDKYFLEITNKIFTDKHIDYNLIMKFIMQRIKHEFINEYPTKASTLKGFMLLNYLDKLNLLKGQEVIKMNEKTKWGEELSKEKELNKKIGSFFETYGDFFDNDAKKSIFLEGVLTQFLFNIQYAERKDTPFRKKLKGLKLDEKHVKNLLPDIQNKLEEYKKNYYRDLEAIISKYLVSAGNGWNLTNDEISFYFVLGMNLSYLFKKEKQDIEGGNEV